jgi:hypothetical protein
MSIAPGSSANRAAAVSGDSGLTPLCRPPRAVDNGQSPFLAASARTPITLAYGTTSSVTSSHRMSGKVRVEAPPRVSHNGWGHLLLLSLACRKRLTALPGADFPAKSLLKVLGRSIVPQERQRFPQLSARLSQRLTVQSSALVSALELVTKNTAKNAGATSVTPAYHEGRVRRRWKLNAAIRVRPLP